MPRIFPDDGLPDDLGELLFRVNRRIRQAANADLGPLGVTPAQVRALRTLDRCDGPIRMSELAERLGIARRSATSVVDDLAARGLVRRRDDPTDRRATTVEVTVDGVALLGRLADRRQQVLGELTAGIPRTDLQRLSATLRRIAQAGELGQH